MNFLTSFSPYKYKLYGKLFLESWVKYCGLPIRVYYERERPDMKDSCIEYRDLFAVQGVTDYLAAVGKFPAFRGLFGNTRDYRRDWFLFCRKCFAQIDMARGYRGRLWWIDADVEFFADAPSAWFEKWFQQDILMTYLGRPDIHSCASLVGWNLEHPQARDFFTLYENSIISGNVFLLPEWHDSYLLDQLRQKMNIPALDMAADVPRQELKGYANVFDTVVPFARHYKGPEKDKQIHSGHS